jgi:cobalt/nickel transport system permease protein
MTLAFDALDAPASPLARRDPRWKLAALIPALFVASALQSPPIVAIAFALSTLLLIGAQLPYKLLLARLVAFCLFLLPFLVILPILHGWPGFWSAWVLAARASAIFILGLILVATSPFSRTVQAAERMGIPKLLSRLVLMSYRYVFVLADEFARLRVALRVRGFRNRANLHSYRTIGAVAGTLLVRGSDRAESVSHAMRCRGFDGRLHSLTEWKTTSADVLFFLAVIAISFGLLAWDWGWRP